MSSIDLSRQFLIAMPSMADPIFARALVFVCDHNDQGAMGVIVNRPLGMDMKTLFQQVDIELKRTELAEQDIYFGGPVQTDRGFVLHQPLGNWQSTMAVEDDLGLTTSKDVLAAVGDGGGPDRLFVSLGYAGWEAGQLEGEMAQNAWLNVDADIELIFSLPAEQRYEAALGLLGIDMAMLSDTAGHA
ncbi:YqgE/AlgH family protein [Chitinimonas sp.]|uniref:YqgE/AlgH family protein n=1 Tax=Chitinimonas sp. TaxID=1934313 RepID=UPI0035B05050